MDFIFRHFWFIGGLFTLINSFIFLKRAKELAKTPEEEKPIWNSSFVFLISAILWFAIGVLQLLGGFSYPFYLVFEPLSNPYVIAALLLLGCYQFLLVYWSYFRKGAQTSTQQRIIAGIGVIVAFIMLMLLRFILPPWTDFFGFLVKGDK